MRHCLLFFILLCSSCGVSTGSSVIPAPPVESSYKGLLFLAGDSSYQASSLYFYDFVAGRIQTISRSETGMAYLFQTGSHILLVNRSETQHNWRTVNFMQNRWQLGRQKALTGAAGDPLAMFAFNEDEIIRGNYNAGTLSSLELNLDSSAVVRETSLSFNIGQNQPLRPVDFWRPPHSGATWVYMLHQGIGQDFTTANGSQAVFALKPDDRGFVEPVDLDENTAAVVGIALPMSAPERFLVYQDDPNPWIAGACSAYLKGNCRAAVGRLRVDAKTFEKTYGWDDHDWIMNGTTVAASAPGQFYAQMATGEAGEGALIAYVDANEKETAEFFRYEQGDSGQWPFWADLDQRVLFVTTSLSEVTGQFLVLDDSGERLLEVELPGNVFSGVLIK